MHLHQLCIISYKILSMKDKIIHGTQISIQDQIYLAIQCSNNSRFNLINNIPVRCIKRKKKMIQKQYPLNPLASNWALGSASSLLGGLVNQFPTFKP
jgi:hypothetical protein